ncbi:MAG: LamG-like jellyroll fold domain-containing protein [bacterium]
MLNFFRRLHVSTKYLLATIILSASVLIFTAIAAPPSSPYSPGDTLAPTCSPGDNNCTVTTPAVSGANSDITSLLGLTTALSIVQGGTATTSVGSAGSLVYSNGTYYDFTATGTSGYVLQANGASIPAWVTTSSLGLGGSSALWTESGNDIYFNTGRTGVGTDVPSSTLHVVSTTEQLRLGYDNENYTSLIIGSDGALTVSSTNGSDMTVHDALVVGGSLSATAGLSINTNDLYVDTGSGNVGMGTTSPVAAVHSVRGDGDPQLRLEYDSSNFVDFFALNGSFVVSSSYATTFPKAIQANDYIVLNNTNNGNDANTILLITGDGAHNSATFNDLSTSNHTISAVNEVHHIRTTRLANDSAILFDKVDDVLTTPNHSDFDIGTGDFTIEAWVYMDDVPASHPEVYRIMAQGDLESANGNWAFGMGNAWGTGYRMNIAIRSGGANVDYWSDEITSIDQATYKWIHFAISRNSGTLRFFMNGIQIGSGTVTESMTTTNSGGMQVGARWGYGSYMEEFDGLMDEIRFSNVARYTSDFVPVYKHAGQDIKFKDGSNNIHTLKSRVSF